jgi:hypothetical protein
MKKIFICIAIIVFVITSYPAAAQLKPSSEDIGKALKGGRLFFRTSKALLAADEQAVLNIKLMITRTGTEEAPLPPYYIDLPDGSDVNLPATYKAGNWKIVQGGGAISSIESNQCVYTSPKKEPKDKIMIISVDLNPTSKALPKVVLLQTLYFVDNPTAIFINLPEAGFNNQEYVNSTSGGAKVPTMDNMDPRVAAKMDAGMKAKMAMAADAMKNAQLNTGIDLGAISSNAMAYYDGMTDITAIKFTRLNMQMQNGKDVRNTPVATSERMICEISFKGQGLGRHTLADKESGVAMFVLASTKACGCGNNRNKEKEEAPCEGYVNIRTRTDKVMTGDFAANVYTSDGTRIFLGSIYGKFTVNIANLQQ